MSIRAKKSLGQNFLHSKSVLEKMARAGNVSSKDTVVEVGPGKGSLTEVLLKTGANVIAIEKDDRLIPILQEKFSLEIVSGQFTLIHGDALEFNPKTWQLAANGYKLVANIPYYITGLLLRHFLESKIPPSTIVLLVQKEVAERIVARDSKESILSLSVKYFGTPTYIGKVSKNLFTPKPKVDSAIILIEDIQKNHPEGEQEAFFKLVKAGFAQKRKLLIKNLEKVATKEAFKTVFQKVQIGETARAETVPIEKWKNLASLFTHI